ncbi:hypothetical protein OG535_38225 [Kitasatospora sp. NBC_00085]|uniref:hypothetical protein n=1 Tax=unclassified Kitasatospora TaxID=2633591 RepID=UPI0032555402
MSSPFMEHGQHPAVWVGAAIPSPLMAALGKRGGIPQTVRGEIGRQLEGGVSPQRLRDRVERRWFLRYSHLTGEALLSRADEIALELVLPPQCPRGVCEDGWLLDDTGSCPECLPNATVVDVADDVSDGRQAGPETYRRAAAAVRARMRGGHRSLHAAEERARTERHEHGRRIPVTMQCAGCRQNAVPALRWQGRPYCRPCLDSCRGCAVIQPVATLSAEHLCAACSG